MVRDEGRDALSRRRVAVELGTGVNTIRRLVGEWADLARLAADQVVTRRRAGRLHRRTDDPMEAVGYEIKALLPEDATHLDEEVVSLKLVACYGLKPSGLEPPGQVKRDFGIAQRGYDIELPHGRGSPAPTDAAPTDPARQEPAPRARRGDAKRFGPASRFASTTSVRSSTRVLDLLDVPAPGRRRRR